MNSKTMTIDVGVNVIRNAGRKVNVVPAFKDSSPHQEGIFHQWGIDSDESTSTSWTVAIVELPGGEIIMPIASRIRFVDAPIIEDAFEPRGLIDIVKAWWAR